MAFCCDIFFFVTAVACLQSIMGFLYGRCKHLLITESSNEYLPDKCYKTVFKSLSLARQFA